MKRAIILGQRIDSVKLEQAKTLRRRMTRAEKRLWAQLRGHRLDGFHFRRQQIIDGFIVDFYCNGPGLVVEVDGRIHETRKEYDAWRDQILEARGLRILRITNDEVLDNIEDVLERIRTACRAASPTPGPGGGRRPNPPPQNGEGTGEGS